ncbi:MAG: ATPase P [Syntrophomonadaceae bacterium]|nr:ATPase P [Syntrophomonadaceae bacterium]
MLQISIPGREDIELHHLLLDMNGTLTVDGLLAEGIKERIEFIKTKMNVFMLTADTFGTGARVAEELGIEIFVVSSVNGTKDKADYIAALEPEGVVAIGNGSNDADMLELASLAIAIIGREGCSLAALHKADIAVVDIFDALDLLINPLRLIATLRV